MDWGLVGTIVGASCGVIVAVYTFLRNFKDDINSHIDRIDDNFKKMDQRVTETNKRMDGVYHILLSRINPKTDP